MDIELEKLKKLEHALHDAIDILRDWQVEEVKLEEERFIAYLARPKYRDCYLTACAEGMWEAVQKEFDAKTELFVGTCDEAVKWYESREKFTEIIKAWEDGKRIQVTPKGTDKWVDLHCEPTWNVDLEYRVNPGCPCEEKTFRPFKDCDELVEFWTKHYQSTRKPMYTKPLIWVRLKCDGRERLIVAFGKGFGTDFVEIGNKAKAVPLQKLFDDYEFLDGKPCGMEVKE